jgi:hypothetical protein
LRRGKRHRFEKWVVVEEAVVYVVSVVARVSRVSQIEKESRVLHVIKRWTWTVATQARGVVNSLPGCTKIPYFFIFFSYFKYIF